MTTPTWPAYGTIAEGTLYWSKHGSPTEWTNATDDARRLAMLEASEYLDASYRWIGDGPLDRAAQVRLWPRQYAYVTEGRRTYLVEGVPQAVKDATYILAVQRLRGVALLPDLTADQISGNVTSISQQVGGLRESVSYQEGTARRTNAPSFRMVTQMLRAAGLIQTGYRRTYP